MTDTPEPVLPSPSGETFVAAIRSAAPYVHAYHGSTFVIGLPGRILQRADTTRLLADIALLTRLGVRVVIVHGARPQIDAEIQVRGMEGRFHGDNRITDSFTMEAVKSAVGALRLDLDAAFSSSLANTPMAGSQVRLVSGNWVIARPVGIRDGVDHGHTGLVRHIDIPAIRHQLCDDQLVLLSPVGYSPTGEALSLRNADVAEAVAIGLGADKLIFVTESEPGEWRDAQRVGGKGHLPLSVAHEVLEQEIRQHDLNVEDRNCVRAALSSVKRGVRRAHLIGTEGASPLLRELYTRDGTGLMIAMDDEFESLRQATPEDIEGILELTEPLEHTGFLVHRSREQIEADIADYTVMVRDGTVIACNALVDFPEDQMAEIASVAVHPEYRGRDLAGLLLRRARTLAQDRGYTHLFALTTQTPHWFLEHGFVRATPADLPTARRARYDTTRNSQVLLDQL